MTDEQLMAAFESCELPPGGFTHVEHVRVAWWYLTRYPFAEARQRFSGALRRFATVNGSPGKYHETITVAYLLLIAERLQDAPEVSWERFADRNAELFARNPSILARHYSDETLQSERAKGGFVLPDRLPLGNRCLRILGDSMRPTMAPDSQQTSA